MMVVALGGVAPGRRYAVMAIQAPAPPPKRPKFDKEMKAEQIRQIQDGLNDLSCVLAFKEKRLQQAEAGRNYRVCEQITEEMMELKSRKWQLEEEKRVFEKNTRANAIQARIR